MSQESHPAPKRAASFQLALAALREALRTGVHPPGARLTAAEIGQRQRLSATPVREALSHLAGEGVLEDRRGQGFFVYRLSQEDIGDLLRLQLQLLLIAVRPGEASGAVAPDRALAALKGPLAGDQAVAAGDHLLRLIASGASRALMRNLRRLQDQLAAVRRLEPHVLPDLAEETARLVHAVGTGRGEALDQALLSFHLRRIALAPQFAKLLEPANIESI